MRNIERNVEGIRGYMKDRKEAYKVSGRGRTLALTLAFSAALGGYASADDVDQPQVNSQEAREAARTKAQKARTTLVGENDARLQEEGKDVLYQEVRDILGYTDDVVKELGDLTTEATSERNTLYRAVREGTQFQKYLTAKIEVLARDTRAMQDEGTAEYTTLVTNLENALEQRATVKKLLGQLLDEPVPEGEVNVKLPELGRVDLPDDALAELRARVERVEATAKEPSAEDKAAYAKLSAASRLYAVMEHEANDLELKCERLSSDVSDGVQVLRDLVEGMRTYKGTLEASRTAVLGQISAVTAEYQVDRERVEELLRKKAEANPPADNPPEQPPANPANPPEQPPANPPADE